MKSFSKYTTLFHLMIVANACAARPPLSTAADRFDRRPNDLDIEVEAGTDTKSEDVGDVRSDGAAEESGITEGTLAGEAGIPRDPSHPTLDELLAVESGSGVNNGSGPTGTQMLCAIDGNTLYLSGTAAPSVAQGSLKWKTVGYNLTCRFQGGEIEWLCKALDSELNVEIKRTEANRYQGTVKDLTEDGEVQVWGSFPCAIPSSRPPSH